MAAMEMFSLGTDIQKYRVAIYEDKGLILIRKCGINLKRRTHLWDTMWGMKKPVVCHMIWKLPSDRALMRPLSLDSVRQVIILRCAWCPTRSTPAAKFAKNNCQCVKPMTYVLLSAENNIVESWIKTLEQAQASVYDKVRNPVSYSIYYFIVTVQVQWDVVLNMALGF